MSGWLRLWILVSIIWVIPSGAIGFLFYIDASFLAGFLAFTVTWLVPIALLYFLGLGIAWVARGFREAGKADQ